MINENEKQLSQKTCRPCDGVGKPLGAAEAVQFLNGLAGWEFADRRKALFREYTFQNFMAAVKFINQVAELAESQGHHPDLHLTGYKHLRIELSTHAIGGLSENDFILAAKINEL